LRVDHSLRSIFVLGEPCRCSMGFLHLFIVNKSGGLIHHRPLSPKAPKIGTNEWLRIGSTFHSLHAIAAEASPVRLPSGKNPAGADDGIEEIVAGNLILRCLQTRTGIKFVVTADRASPVSSTQSRGGNTSNASSNSTRATSDVLDGVLKEIYCLYSDCVLKDPFYELEMPIRSELFVQSVDALIEKYESNFTSSKSGSTKYSR
jgi:trafficking protein particle complex subunit 4